MVRAVAAGGALDPDEVASGVGDEEEALRGRAYAEVDEVLAASGGCAGGEGELWGFFVEGGETEEVRGERLGRVCREWWFVEEGEFEVVLVVGGGGGGGREMNEDEERDQEDGHLQFVLERLGER